MTDRDTARAAKDQLRAELARLPGVTGVGLGRREGDYVITVSVTEQAACEHVPPHFHGVTVEVRVSGSVRALRGGSDDGTGAGTAGTATVETGTATAGTGTGTAGTATARVTSGPVETPPSAAGDGRRP